MKSRVLALALAALMLLTALPALADAPTLNTVTLSGVTLTIDDKEPLPIGLTGAFKTAVDGERMLLSGLIKGGALTVADFQCAFEDGQVFLSLDNLTSNYAMKAEDFEQKAEASGAPAAEALEVQALAPLAEAMVRELLDDEANRRGATDEARQEMGYTRIGEEQVLLFGEQATLTRYESVSDAETMDALMQVDKKYYPAMHAFMQGMDGYMQTLSQTMGEEPPIPSTDPNYYARMRDEKGEDTLTRTVVWADDTGNNSRGESVQITTITPKGGGDKVMRTATVSTESRMVDGVLTLRRVQRSESETGALSTITIDATATQEPGKLRKGALSFEVKDEQPQGAAKALDSYPAVTRFSFDVDQDLDGTGVARYAFGSGFGKDELGTALALDMKFDRPDETGAQAARIGIDVRNTYRDYAADEALKTSKVLLEMDALLERAALPEGALFDELGKPTLDIPSLTEDQQLDLEREITTKGFMAYGALMQTEGIAKLMAESMLDMQHAMDAMLNSIDGPGASQFAM